MLWVFEFKLPEFDLDNFIELLKKAIDSIYAFIWDAMEK